VGTGRDLRTTCRRTESPLSAEPDVRPYGDDPRREEGHGLPTRRYTESAVPADTSTSLLP
jgi:hypothetical protein